MKRIILASASPRRKELLEKVGIPFEVMESSIEDNIDQIADLQNSPYEWVKTLSSKKANDVATNVEGSSIIIAADTIITILGKIMEKPTDVIDAFQMLKRLQGRKHTVYTGMTIIYKDEMGITEENYVDATDVYMHELTDEEIKQYIDTHESFDKAGGYAIQGKGTLLIDTIYGDYNTVVGLPLTVLYKALKAHGVNIMDFWKNN